MSSNISWDTVRQLVDECLFYLPNETQSNIGPFFLDKQFFDNSFSFAQEKESRWTRIDFPTEQTGLSEMMLLVGYEKMIYSLDSTTITQEPFYFGVQHPHFQYHWKNDDKTGRLIFFRIDLNLDTFVNYTAENDFKADIYGDTALCTKLPKSLTGVTEVFEHTVLYSIDYQKKAAEILALSQLEAFVVACKEQLILH